VRIDRDLLWVAAAAVVCAAIAVAVPQTAIREIAAVPLCLLLPGYALTAAIFAKTPLPGPHQLLLTITLSLASLALGALLLNYMPGGIRESTWIVLLLVVVLGGCSVAAWRRTQGPRRVSRPISGGGIGRGGFVRLAGGVLLGAAAIVIAWTPFNAENAVGYTQFWMLPGRTGGFELGVRSQEHDATTYRVVLDSGKRRTTVASRLALEPGQDRVFHLTATPSRPGAGHRLTALLFLQDQPGKPYRRVTAILPASTAG
jgi:uncharacterized membrane protein